jgi:two-component system NtrC family sensor kinase
VVTIVLATRHLSHQVDLACQQREELFHAFMRSAKLASVGELATGLAHEINNPLAIISAEQTNLVDLVEEAGPSGIDGGDLRPGETHRRAGQRARDHGQAAAVHCQHETASPTFLPLLAEITR